MEKSNRISHLRKIGINIYNRLPEGWKYNEHAQTNPKGYKWADNGEPLFTVDNGTVYYNSKHQFALVKHSITTY